MKDQYFQIFLNLFFCFFIQFLILFEGFSQEKTSSDQLSQTKTVDAGNEGCFKCHGYFLFHEEKPEKSENRLMDAKYIIKREIFYQSNHQWLQCIDCHDFRHIETPHPVSLKQEIRLSCFKCHGQDEPDDEFNFELIDEEYNNSIHYMAADSIFSCWSCHDPHSYKIFARYSKNISKIVEYNNNICLQCHGKVKLDQLRLSSSEVLQKHDWLPNQYLHFKNVRCIECHSPEKENLLISHNILPGENAVKKCVECHSNNSLLLSSLYKYQSIENRKELGFVNSIILNNSYVIGANKNKFLNVASQMILGIVIGMLIIHGILRVVILKK